jgi:hypothetical protein
MSEFVDLPMFDVLPEHFELGDLVDVQTLVGTYERCQLTEIKDDTAVVLVGKEKWVLEVPLYRVRPHVEEE